MSQQHPGSPAQTTPATKLDGAAQQVGSHQTFRKEPDENPARDDPRTAEGGPVTDALAPRLDSRTTGSPRFRLTWKHGSRVSQTLLGE